MISIRVYLESEAFGREYYSDGETLEENMGRVKRLVGTSIDCCIGDGITRRVGIEIGLESEGKDGGEDTNIV